MKKFLLLAALLCALVLALASCNLLKASQLEFTSNGDGTCYVSGIGTCTDTDIVIPETSPWGDRVTSIASYAFSGCTSPTSIEIPTSVTSIGSYAFFHCTSLTSVEIPPSVTSIGEGAFYNCTSLTTVTFAEGSQLAAICYAVFSDCTSLTSIEIPDSVTSIGKYAFSYCSSLTDVYFAGSEEEWAAIEIGDYNDPLENANIHYNHTPEE